MPTYYEAMGAPNVIWIVLDSVRADHTSMAGYRRDTTPRLQSIAESDGGRWFSQCIAPSVWTVGTTASVLTGTYHSVHNAGHRQTVPEEFDRVPELLSDVGYHTAGLSKNPHIGSEALRLHRGFDQFELVSFDRLLEGGYYRTLAKYGANVTRHSAGFTTDRRKHSTPFLLNDIAKRWLRSFAGADEPFFCYLHYNEPHKVYYPPRPYLDRYTDDIAMSTEEAAAFSLNAVDHVNEHGYDLTDEQLAALEAMYDAEIAYTDECIGRLFEHVQSLDLGETVFLVTADHGELFGERDTWGSGGKPNDYFDEGLINVPLVVHGMDLDGVAEDDLLGQIDLMQAILNRAGADTGQFQGIDPREQQREFTITQQRVEKPDGEWFATCLRTREHKLVRSRNEERVSTVEDEPLQSEDESAVRSRLSPLLDEWESETATEIRAGATVDFDDGVRERLSELGYVID